MAQRTKKPRSKKPQRRRDVFLTKHHLIPSSRGGTSDPENLKKVDSATHNLWHRIFLNWTPEEIIKMLEIFGRSIFIRDIRSLGRNWKKLFGDKPDEEIIEIIEEEWS